jgi:hypothetical protein
MSLVAAALSDKIYTGADIVDSLFQVGWGIFYVEVRISFLMKLQWSRAY